MGDEDFRDGHDINLLKAVAKQFAEDLGFDNVASAPMVRSSYHADLQAVGESVD